MTNKLNAGTLNRIRLEPFLNSPLNPVLQVTKFICYIFFFVQVIRSYHGHLSGVYCLALHPTIDILLTGGRDSVCRV